MSAAPSSPPRVAVFGFDVTEASQIKSIRSILSTGAKVESFTFRRDNMNAGFAPEWPDRPLGRMGNGVGPARCAALARAAVRLIRYRGLIRRSDVLVARNLDMALLALFARAISGSRARLVYQCLDIHPLMTGRGLISALARAAERLVLRAAHRLVISSPRFDDAHFRTRQQYRGDIFLMENKIWWPGPAPERTSAVGRGPGPLRLGWVGTLRCPKTLDLLLGIAKLLDRRVEVVLRGVVHHHALPDFWRRIGDFPNVVYDGPYSYPGDLGAIYGDIDLVWGQELSVPGGNTDWLLPNRLYEAPYFGCPLVAVRGTETGRRVADGLGFVLDQATPEALAALLTHLTPRHLERVRRALRARPATEFCLTSEEVAAMLDVDVPPPHGNRIHARAA